MKITIEAPAEIIAILEARAQEMQLPLEEATTLILEAYMLHPWPPRPIIDPAGKYPIPE